MLPYASHMSELVSYLGAKPLGIICPQWQNKSLLLCFHNWPGVLGDSGRFAKKPEGLDSIKMIIFNHI